MSKDNDKQNIYNQSAFILNYQPYIGNQTNNFGTPHAEETEGNDNIHDNPPKAPHFALDDSEPMRRHWVDVYNRLVQKRWIRKCEVECHEWVYVCCGIGTQPLKLIVWHGTTAALAYIVRYKLMNWNVARKTFCLKDGKSLPDSFETTHNPAPNTCDAIDDIFK